MRLPTTNLPVALRGLAGEATAVARCAARYPLGLIGDGRGGGAQPGSYATPVVLVHGYAHNHSGWWAVERRLRAAGFAGIHTVDYLPHGQGVPALAARLGRKVEAVRRLTGSQRVHLVAHSLGGVLARWYVQELGGASHVATAITLGSPHEGTLAAYLWPERSAADLRPGSAVLDRLRDGAGPSEVSWVALYSDADLLVRPPSSGALRVPGLRATNIALHGIGHMSLLVSSKVADAVVAQLEAAEGRGAPLVPLRAPLQVASGGARPAKVVRPA